MTDKSTVQQCIDLIRAFDEGFSVSDAIRELENLRDSLGLYPLDEFRLTSPLEGHTFWLVWKREGHKGDKPLHRHPTHESAMREARRLSMKFPGCKIYVLEATQKFLDAEMVNYPVPNEIRS